MIKFNYRNAIHKVNIVVNMWLVVNLSGDIKVSASGFTGVINSEDKYLIIDVNNAWTTEIMANHSQGPCFSRENKPYKFWYMFNNDTGGKGSKT